MVALIDIDSLMYRAAYKLDDPAFVEKCGLSNEDYDTIIGSLAEIASDRLENMLNDILLDIEKDENNIHITSQEIYVTTCKHSIRKQIYPEYKANRERNAIVDCLRSLYLFKNDAITDDVYEADDLIADRARELNGNYIIITMDKDLKQIGGFIYDFYAKPSKKDEQGNVVEVYPRRGLSYVSKIEGAKFLAKQMISGDSGDAVSGLPRYGKKTASKIIDPCNSRVLMIRKVIETYQKVYGEEYIEPLQQNFRLLYLGKY